MDFRNYIPPDGGHVGCGIWQSRSLIQDSDSKVNKWTKERLSLIKIQVAKATNGQKNGSVEERMVSPGVPNTFYCTYDIPHTHHGIP